MTTEQGELSIVEEPDLTKQTTQMSIKTEESVNHKDVLVQEITDNLEAILDKLTEAGSLVGVVEDVCKEDGGVWLVDTALKAERASQDDLINVLTQLELTSATESLKLLIQQNKKGQSSENYFLKNLYKVLTESENLEKNGEIDFEIVIGKC